MFWCRCVVQSGPAAACEGSIPTSPGEGGDSPLQRSIKYVDTLFCFLLRVREKEQAPAPTPARPEHYWLASGVDWRREKRKEQRPATTTTNTANHSGERSDGGGLWFDCEFSHAYKCQSALYNICTTYREYKGRLLFAGFGPVTERIMKTCVFGQVSASSITVFHLWDEEVFLSYEIIKSQVIFPFLFKNALQQNSPIKNLSMLINFPSNAIAFVKLK